jgi:NADH:ubiquinone oxidoreductase subunit E
MMVNRTYFGKLSPPKVASVLAQYRKEEGDRHD